MCFFSDVFGKEVFEKKKNFCLARMLIRTKETTTKSTFRKTIFKILL